MDPAVVLGLRVSLAALFAVAALHKIRHFALHRGHVAGYLAACGIASPGAVRAAAVAIVLAELGVTARPAGPARGGDDRGLGSGRLPDSHAADRQSRRRRLAEVPVSTTVYVAVIALWVVTLALGVAVVALARQIGVIHQRLAPVGALMTNRTPKVGERSPAFSLPTLDGAAVAIGATTPAERAMPLVFVSPQCPVCAVLIPAIRAIAAAEAAWLGVLLVADAPEAEMRQFQRDKRVADIPLAISPEIGVAFRIAKLPYAVLLDERSVIAAQGLVNTRENLESLFEARRRGVASGAEYRARQVAST